MPINESVYGAKESWYVPSKHYEFGTEQYADVYYYNQIAADDKLKIKIANYNTLESPVTTMRSQMEGQYTSESYLIRNNWKPTKFTMDNSVVQFGIGPQSGLSDQEWWYVDRAYGASDPSETEPPVLKNVDKYDITNMCLATRSNYAPYEFYTAGRGSVLGGYDNNYMYWQMINRQVLGTINSKFILNYNPTYGYETGYVNTKLVTQIPIKNLKLTPVIYAYTTALDNYKKFTSIQGYLDEKSSYPYIFCIKAKFMYRSGFDNDTDYGYSFDCYPWFFNPSSFLSGYGYRFNNKDSVYGDVYYPNRGDKETGQGITIAGRPGYAHGPNGGMLGNEIYWYGHSDNSSTYNFTIGQGGRVLQTPDFKFVLGNKNLFYCDTSSMTDDQITQGIRKQLASFGMFFVDGEGDLNLALDDDKTFLGILEDGVGYGKYSHGEKNREQDQWNWDTMGENKYDPKNPPMVDPNLYGINMTFNAPWVSSPHTLYSFNSVGTGLLTIQQLFHKLWQNYADKKEEWLKGTDHTIFNWNLDDFNYDQYLMMNPIDCIVSLKLFPYDTAQNPESEYTTIKLGKYNTSIPAKTAYYYKSFNFGSATIFPYFGADHQQANGNWIDRLTQYTFYAPFCGTAEIDANKYMGQELNLTYTIDQITGACTATLETTDDDGATVHIVSLTGTCAVDIPITGLDQATIQSQIFNANQQLKAANTRALVGLANDVTSMITHPSIPGFINAAGRFASNDINVESAKYNLHHQPIAPHTINSASPLCGMMMDYTPRIIVSQPVIADNFSEATFKDNKGFACIIPGTIGNHKGYFEINDFKWAGDATPTDTEIEMIRSLLAGGVYVG